MGKIREFNFKNLTKEQMVEIVDKKFPISLRYNEELIEKVHSRYPLITKAEVAVIVKFVFETMREFMILCKVINFNKVFINLKMYFSKRKVFGKHNKLMLLCSIYGPEWKLK